MERIKLGEICEIVSGSTPQTSVDEYWDGNISWITPAELSDETYIIEESQRKITHKAVLETGLRSFPKGTVILSSRAPIGKVAIAGREMYCNQGFKNLICSDRIDSRYLYWYLKGHTDYLNSLGRGATFKEISKDIVGNIEIPLPNLDKQITYSEILKKCWDLMAMKKKQIEAFDTLIKSRFVEMFGELGSNPKGYPAKTLAELCSKITDGKHGGCETEAGTGRFFVGAREIYDGVVHYDTAPEIMVRDFEKDYKRCNIEIGDFLIVNTGATIGKSAIATDERTTLTLLQKSVALLKVRSEQMLPIFLRYCYMANPQMYMVESASAQPNLLLSKIKATTVYVPPIDQQQVFATFVADVDKLKVAVQKSIDELQLLFDSLMQKYFNQGGPHND